MYGSRIKIAVFFIIGLVILLTATKPAIFTSNRIAIVDAAAPGLKFLKGASSFIKRLIPFASYRDEIERLRSKTGLLSQEVLRLKEAELENARLKNLLNFRTALRLSAIPAQVIGRDPSNWSNSIIIDKGRDQAIRPNMAVISSLGLVGRVIEAGRYSSKILLITDPNSKVGVILEKTRQGGILVGRRAGSCRMIYISLDTDVTPGEKVFTAGYGGVFPKDLVAGEVISSGKEPGRLYKYAIVKTSCDFSRLEEVFCIK